MAVTATVIIRGAATPEDIGLARALFLEYARWLKKFLPGLSAKKAFSLVPAVVADPTDGRLVHLDGLNLTRAWTLKGIAGALPAKDPRRALLQKASDEHARAGLARVSSGNYEGEHWLASFAVYLLTEP